MANSQGILVVAAAGNVWEWVEDTWTTEHTSDEKVRTCLLPEARILSLIAALS